MYQTSSNVEIRSDVFSNNLQKWTFLLTRSELNIWCRYFHRGINQINYIRINQQTNTYTRNNYKLLCSLLNKSVLCGILAFFRIFWQRSSILRNLTKISAQFRKIVDSVQIWARIILQKFEMKTLICADWQIDKTWISAYDVILSYIENIVTLYIENKYTTDSLSLCCVLWQDLNQIGTLLRYVVMHDHRSYIYFIVLMLNMITVDIILLNSYLMNEGSLWGRANCSKSSQKRRRTAKSPRRMTSSSYPATFPHG